MEAAPQSTVFIPPEGAVDISPELTGGLWKQIKKEGTGSDYPLTGDTVYVHYVGTLLDGTKFDSSRDRGDKFEFKLGEGNVIRGWDVGVSTMHRGEVAVLTCKSDFAYGAAGSPPKIPPNATLVFEVELFDWKGEDVTNGKDGGVIKSILLKGSGHKSPKEEALVKIYLSAFYNEKQFDDREVEFTLGDGEEHGITEGVELALYQMKLNELARIHVKSKYAYGVTGWPEKNIPPNADVKFEVELLSFENMKEGWEMETAEKLEQSELVKQKGTMHFKNGKFRRAKTCYNKIIDYLKYEELEEDDKGKRDVLLLAAHLNLAMCAIKMKNYTDAMKSCDSALELDEQNEKALFRRGMVNMDLGNYEEAIKDFKAVLDASPENKAAKNQIILAQHKIKEFRNREKKIFGGMFDKFAKIDAAKEPQKPATDPKKEEEPNKMETESSSEDEVPSANTDASQVTTEST